MIKNILIGILIAIVVYLFFIPKDVEKQVVTKEVRELVQAEVEDVNGQIDAKGFKHAVIEAVQNVVSSDKQMDSSAIHQRDSVLRLLQIKDKQLSHWISYSVTLEEKVLTAIKTDTGFRYQDRWANIEYIKPTDTIGDGHFNFRYNADISYAEYWKKAHVFAPKKHYIDFWINDPRATINKVKRIKFEVTEPKFGMDVNSKAMFNGVDQKVYIGGEASVDIGRLNLSGSYLYSPVAGRWYPFVSGKYRIIGF